MNWTLLVRGGTVVDGTGAPPVVADVAVEGERIAAVGAGLPGEGVPTIDASDKLVAPGFIDIHSHSDFFLFDCPSAESKVRQGVTTEVVGMCGFSPAPLVPARRDALERVSDALGSRLRTRWTGFDEYLERLGERPLAVNVVPFVGHGALRLATVGTENRTASAAELSSMQDLLRAALDAGAFGFSTGLVYPPGAYADTDELVALARSMAARAGLYFTHIRGEAQTLERAIEEAIEIGRRAGVGVEIAHLKAAGRESWPRFTHAVELIDDARRRSCDVSADVYPYNAGSTMMIDMLPGWVLQGGVADLARRLHDPGVRMRLQVECRRGADRWCSGGGIVAWDDIMIATCSDPRLAGMSIAELAAREKCSGADAMLDLLEREEGAVSMVRFNQSEQNVVQAIEHPAVMIGSDSIALTAGSGPHPGCPHPRTYGTFPRVLGHYVRERKILGWEEAVHKMTGMTADRLGLSQRGFVRPGCFADLVVFDPVTVKDEATYHDPHRHPTGIPHVVVNGEVVVGEGEMRSISPGRILSSRQRG